MHEMIGCYLTEPQSESRKFFYVSSRAYFNTDKNRNETSKDGYLGFYCKKLDDL